MSASPSTASSSGTALLRAASTTALPAQAAPIQVVAPLHPPLAARTGEIPVIRMFDERVRARGVDFTRHRSTAQRPEAERPAAGRDPHRPKSSLPMAACAVAVLGAVSASALLLPQASPASADGTDDGPSPSPTDVVPTTATTHLIGKRGHRHHHRHHRAPVQPSASATATPAASPTASPSPSGTTAAAGGGSLLSAIGSAVGNLVSLAAGTFSMSNFSSSLIGVKLPSAGLTGAGIGKTILEMLPGTSTRAGNVSTAAGSTNQLYLATVSGSPTLSGFTLQGTQQGHLYNGLRLDHTTDAHVSDIKIAAIPGNDHVNPGETFALNDWHGNGNHYTDIEVDGAGVGASGFATNSSTNITVADSYFHDNPYSAGAAFWQTSNITITDTRSIDNRTGFNFERVSGTVNLIRPTIEGNTSQDLYIGSDQSSATYNIVDPVYSGTKLRIRLPTTYGTGNQQKKSDIHVIINGIDETNTVVQWLT